MDEADRLEEVFRARGLRVTPQRRRVFKLIARRSGHLTAEEVWREVRMDMPMVSLKTVYEILHELCEIGEMREVNLDHGSMRFDLNSTPHHHLICENCGRILDLDAGSADAEGPAESDRGGFRVDSVEVIFRGLCAECQAAA